MGELNSSMLCMVDLEISIENQGMDAGHSNTAYRTLAHDQNKLMGRRYVFTILYMRKLEGPKFKVRGSSKVTI